ncbi:MAG: hypothetical protein JNL78_06040 [Rhodocyclaceae bacterium]|nr:hypothetical protein [Rhodocyclaceae bacterium]
MRSALLSQLADRFGSDKGSLHGDRHRYAQFYELLLHEERNSLGKMIELGLARGGPEDPQFGATERQCDSPSLGMWVEYFPQAEIFGFDISDFSHLERRHDRFRFFRGDCGREADLIRLREAVGRDVDLVIDDASHASFHQQLALKTLFPCLRPGGLYVIEDLHWQPPHIEASLPAVPRTYDWLKALQDGNGLTSLLWSADDLRMLAGSIASLLVLTDLQVPGSRYRNAIGAMRKRQASE